MVAVDLFRRLDRLEDLLRVCVADARGRLHHHDRPYPQEDQRRALAAAVRAANTATIARAISDHRRIPKQIRQARIKAIRQHRR